MEMQLKEDELDMLLRLVNQAAPNSQQNRKKLNQKKLAIADSSLNQIDTDNMEAQSEEDELENSMMPIEIE